MRTRKEIFETIIRAMTGGSPRIRFSEIALTNSVTLTVEPSPVDFGAIIGRQAVHYKALEFLYQTSVEREDGRAGRLIVVTPDDKVPQHRMFTRNPGFGKPTLTALVKAVAGLLFTGGVVEVHKSSRDSFLVEVVVGDELPEYERTQDALRVVFNAIGKANGVDVMLDVAQIAIPNAA